MKNYIIRMSVLLFTVTINASQIQQMSSQAMQAEIDKRIQKVESSLKADATYMTNEQLQEYKKDLNTYADAVKDALEALPEEISNNLETITPWNPNLVKSPDNQHILVVSWMSEWAYDNFYKNVNPKKYGPKYEFLSWVTIPAETQKFIRAFKKTNPNPKDLQKRLTQWLGLPPEEPGHEAKKVFVEMWVKPEDLMRPCMNNNIVSNSCATDLFPHNSTAPFEDFFTIAGETTNRDYADWYKQERSAKYTTGFIMPWTRLGYTFDWGTDFKKTSTTVPEKGATEFIIRPGSEVMIKQGIPTEKYGLQESSL